MLGLPSGEFEAAVQHGEKVGEIMGQAPQCRTVIGFAQRSLAPSFAAAARTRADTASMS